MEVHYLLHYFSFPFVLVKLFRIIFYIIHRNFRNCGVHMCCKNWMYHQRECVTETLLPDGNNEILFLVGLLIICLRQTAYRTFSLEELWKETRFDNIFDILGHYLLVKFTLQFQFIGDYLHSLFHIEYIKRCIWYASEAINPPFPTEFLLVVCIITSSILVRIATEQTIIVLFLLLLSRKMTFQMV